MMKIKLRRIVWLIVLLVCMNVSLCMAKEPVIYNSYAENNELHIFVGNAEETDAVSCQIGNVSCDNAVVQKTNRIETYLLVDNSLSIADKYRDTIRQILEKLVASRAEQESMTIATFDTDVHYLVEKSQNTDELKKAVEGITYQNLDTKITDVIYRLCKTLEADPYNGLRRIILISDGAEFATVGYTRQEVQTELQKLAYPLYTVGCTYKENTNDLEEMFSLSRLTGAEYIWLDQINDTDSIVNTLNTALQTVQVTVPLEDSLMDGSSKGIKLTIQNSEGVQSVSTVRNMPFPDAGTQAVNGLENSEQDAMEIPEESDISSDLLKETGTEKEEVTEAVESQTDVQKITEAVESQTDDQEITEAVEPQTDVQDITEGVESQRNEQAVTEKESQTTIQEVTEEVKAQTTMQAITEEAESQISEQEVTEEAELQTTMQVITEEAESQISEQAVTEVQTGEAEKKEDPLLRPMLLILLALMILLLVRRKMSKGKKTEGKKSSKSKFAVPEMEEGPTMYGNEEGPTMYGNEEDPTMYGNEEGPTMYGNEEGSTIYGDEEEPTVYGDEERTVFGDNEETRYSQRKYIMVRFTDMRNPDTVIEVPLFTQISVGSDRKVNPVAFENESSVAPVHCEVLRRSNRIYVHDLNSGNGTWVDDEMVEDEMELYSGAVLRMGQMEVIFETIGG